MMLDEMKQLIIEYVARQQLVYEVILQLSSVSFIIGNKSIGTHEIWMQAFKYKDIPDVGIWQRYGVIFFMGVVADLSERGLKVSWFRAIGLNHLLILP